MKVEGKKCSGPRCPHPRLGKLLWCERCREVSVDVRDRWLKALRVFSKLNAIPDAIWDEYLEARGEFVRAREKD